MKCFEMLVTAKDEKDLEEILDVIAVNEEFTSWLPGSETLYASIYDASVPGLYRDLLYSVIVGTVAYKALETSLVFPKWVRAYLKTLVQGAPLPLDNLKKDIQDVQEFRRFVDRLIAESPAKTSAPAQSHEQWLALLADVERELPERIRSGGFRSMHVTYAKPFVERLFFQRGEHRVFLHRIEGCKPEEALWHAHPWPSLIKVLDTEGGAYRHTVGARTSSRSRTSADNDTIVSSVQTSIATPMNTIVYTMLNPDAYHSVCTDRCSWSVMITGTRWSPPEPSKLQSALEPARVQELLTQWARYYP